MSESKPKGRWLSRSTNLIVPLAPLRGLRRQATRSTSSVRYAAQYLWARFQQARHAPKVSTARLPDAAEAVQLTRNARVVWCVGLVLCLVSASLVIVARHAPSTLMAVNCLIGAAGLAVMGLMHAFDAARLVHTLRIGREIPWAEYFDARNVRWWIPF